ncbi:MAG: tRNA (adenosine(37)-N6)-threonylcarbamoyltransferase complex dimerization subunit type 1 TsaB [Pseudomonadota bacterium]
MSQPDSTILAFDTSAAHCAAALLMGDKIVSQRFEEMKKGQAERLFPMLEEVLGEVGAVWEELDAVGVGVGPGNFTGIRIAVSAARGLALSLEIPAIGVSGFEALRGERYRSDPAPMIVSLPATRRGADAVLQYFADATAVGSPVELAMFGKDVIDKSFERYPQTAHVLGHEAAAVNYAVQLDKGEYTYLEFGPAYPQAEQIARLAAHRLVSGKSFPRPAPFYIRPPDAAPSADPPPVILP